MINGFMDRIANIDKQAAENGKKPLVVDYSVLAKVQQLRMQLEDFQAILKLNESMKWKSPKPTPHTAIKKQPDYMKHRRTNSRKLRSSLELPRGIISG